MEPDSCICSTEYYTCRADLVTGMEIDSSGLTDPFFYIVGFSRRLNIVKEGLRVVFSEGRVNGSLSNLTAQLFIIDQQTWNGSNFSCRAAGRENKTFFVFVTGEIFLPIISFLHLYTFKLNIIRSSLPSH